MTGTNLGKQSLADFQKYGFFILRSAVDPQIIDKLQKALDVIINQLDEHDYSETFFWNGSRVVYENERLHRIVWCGAIDKIFLEVARMDVFLQPLTELLQPKNQNLVQLINQLHFKFPQDGVKFDYHQDGEHRSFQTPHWKPSGPNESFIQTALAIDPMDEKNGPLEFFKGSHELGFLGGINSENEHLLKKYPLVKLELNPGDLAFFHPLCVHGSKPNISDKPRKILINGFTIEGVNHKSYPGCGLGEVVSVQHLKRNVA
jgi:ectoine hydroxylase